MNSFMKPLILLSVLACVESFTSLPVPNLRASSSSTWIASSAEGVGDGEDAAASNDILNSPEFLARKLDVLKSDLESAGNDLVSEQQRYEEGKAEWGDQLDELAKEYKNIQERMNTQSSKGDDMATVQVARQMLDVLDNFDRAFGAVRPETEEELAVEAEYKQVYAMILDGFKELGIEQVPTVGSEFDYEYHQAVMQKPSDEYEEGICCDELAKGFKFGTTLIRAAMVAVAV